MSRKQQLFGVLTVFVGCALAGSVLYAQTSFGRISGSVTDPSGASSSDTVVINVVDTTAPVISGVPADINATATSVNGAVVTFNP